jgi:BirA family transcriptional regulator, biotin operon repressor / biotin---[acetyl-CoA-carboxylase] ligase
MFTSKDITDGLPTRCIGQKVFAFESIDSTNTCARLLAESGVENGTVVFAEHQTKGRGRLNRKWTSEKERNLLFSVILYPDFDERRYFIVPLMISVCIVKSIEKLKFPVPLTVKWPNDVLLENGKKIAGILTEITHTYDGQPRIVAGIGVNVNQTHFPESLVQKASSLLAAAHIEFDRMLLLRTLLVCIEEHYAVLSANPEHIIEMWRSLCTMFQKIVTVEQHRKTLSGVFRDIDTDGALLLETANGKTIRIMAGDVSAVSL